jgi:hypothetical protein
MPVIINEDETEARSKKYRNSVSLQCHLGVE